MTGERSLFGAVGLALAVSLAACSSPDPALYTIAPAPGAAQANGPKVIQLQRIGLARYLERSQIIRSSENYRLDVMSNDWWGEPLATMLNRVLVVELSQRLPQSNVLGEGSGVSAASDATIELSVLRLDEDASGVLVLEAQAGVRFTGHGEPVLHSFHFTVPPSAPGVRDEVAAISVAVGQLADGLAAILVAGPKAS